MIPCLRVEALVEDVVLSGVRKSFRGDASRLAHDSVSPGVAPAAVDGVSLRVARGERIVIVGPSGCGKSTLLRLIAGLDDVDEGTIAVAGRNLRGVAPQDRDVAMVFQGYALYPHMSASDNIAFPLRMRGLDREARTRAVADVARVLRIGHLLDRRPAELSGGERQRVAIGRALVRRPKVFLFDEPLSNLDAALRNDLRVELGQIFDELSGACLYVTHDQVEAMTLADRIVVMDRGKVLQEATPREIYLRPATAFVATFIGSPKMNLLPGIHDETSGSITIGEFRLKLSKGLSEAARPIPDQVLVGIRPEDVAVDAADPDVRASVVSVEPLGAETVITAKLGVSRVRLRTAGFDSRKPGDSIGLTFDSSRVHLFEAGGDQVRIG